MADNRTGGKLVIYDHSNSEAVKAVSRHARNSFNGGAMVLFAIFISAVATENGGRHSPLAWAALVFLFTVMVIGGVVLVRNALGGDSYNRLRNSGAIIELEPGSIFVKVFDTICRDEKLQLSSQQRKEALAKPFIFEAAVDTREAVRSYNELKAEAARPSQQRREEAKIRARVRQGVLVLKAERQSLAEQSALSTSSDADGGAYVPGVSPEDVDAEIGKMRPRQISD